MEYREPTDREKQAAKEATCKMILESEFFTAIVVTRYGTRVTTVGQSVNLLAAVLQDDITSKGELLTELTDLRQMLAEIIEDFLQAKETPHIKTLKTLNTIAKIIEEKQKQKKENETRND